MAEKAKQNQLMAMMEEWFSKLPELPKNWKEVIVKITPWLALIFGILGVLGTLAAFGVLTALAPVVLMSSGVGVASGGVIGAVLALAASALLLAAFPGTKNMRISGWNLLFWSEVVSLVSAVVVFSLGGVLASLIGFYLLFQIKSFYK